MAPVPPTGIVPKPLRPTDYNVFMSPLKPLSPTIQGEEPRRFDYPTGYNISYIPRSYEGISFEMLRTMAEMDYLVRICIETRKDQLSKLSWRVGLKAAPGEPHAKLKEHSENDPRVKKVKQFLMKPDGVNGFHEWVRQWFEDMLVIDAASLLIGRKNPENPKSDVTRLVPADGATFHLNIGPDGTRPRHPNFAFQQVIKGQIHGNLSDAQLLYMPRNQRTHKVYGFSPVEQIIFMINMGLRRDMSKLSWFTDGNIPDAVAQVPQDWSPAVIEQFQNAFDAALSGNVQARRMLRFIPALGDKGPGQITVFKEAMLMDQWEEWRARIVAFCFSLPPNAFVKMMNRATAQSSQRAALEEGFMPSKLWIQERIDQDIIQNPYCLNEPDVEFNWEDEPEIDPLQQAQVDKIYVSIGKVSIDELRERDGEEPLGIKHFVLTAQGPIMLEDVKSGDGRVLPGKPKMLPAAGNGAAPGTPANGKATPQLGSTKVPDSPPEGAKKFAKTEDGKKKIQVSAGTLPQESERRITSLAGSISRFLKKQGQKIASEITDRYAEVYKDDEDEARRILEALGIDWDSLIDGIGDALTDAGQKGASDLLMEFGISDKELFGQVAKRALSYAKDRAAELVGKRWVNGELVDNPSAHWAITETTREELKQLVIKAFADGMSPRDLENAIRDSFQFSAQRAEMIARTEIARAHIEGAIEGAKASGVVTKKFVLLGSEHAETVGVDECDAAVDDGKIALDKDFSNGMSAPPFHPNCVCAVEFVYEGE